MQKKEKKPEYDLIENVSYPYHPPFPSDSCCITFKALEEKMKPSE
jgi:hypothetical protein